MWIARIPEDSDPGDLRDDLLEQLQLFAEDFVADAVAQPRDVPARLREACDSPAADGIANSRHNDGNRSRGVLGCLGFWRPRRKNDVHLQTDQLSREVGQPVEPALCRSILEDNILTLDPAAFTQPLPKRFELGERIRSGPSHENTYPRGLCRLLRPGGERRGEEAEGKDDCERSA